MKYKLYLDDLRHLPDLDPYWRLARNYHDAQWYVLNYGIPYHISFDHDLGITHYAKIIGVPNELSGLVFAKWFCYHVLDNDLKLPDDFSYAVHSANPVGAENIRSFMDGFLKDGYV